MVDKIAKEGPDVRRPGLFMALPLVPPSPSAADDPHRPISPLRNTDLDFEDLPGSDGLLDTPDSGTECDGHRRGEADASSTIDRGRSTPGTKTPGASRKQSSRSSPPPPPPAKRKRQEPDFAEGYKATRGAKSKAADYEPIVEALLLRAMLEYTMHILTNNAFPDVSLQVVWAKESWKSACCAANQHFKVNQQMIKLVSAVLSVVSSRDISAHLRSRSAGRTSDPRLLPPSESSSQYTTGLIAP